jgi:AcrR family transcriptional regulator
VFATDKEICEHILTFVNSNMSPSSSLPSPSRRVPVQSRSERRVASFLFHAEAVIAEVGYEATTMTEIASRAQASIGSLYQYFPNKETITVAVFRRYINELVTRWATLSTRADQLDPSQLGAQIIEQFIEFATEQPAFFPILSAPVDLKKNPAARHRMREQFAALFLRKNPALGKAGAHQVAVAALGTVKSLIDLCSEARPRERILIVAEYKQMLSAYLSRRLAPGRPKSRS